MALTGSLVLWLVGAAALALVALAACTKNWRRLPAAAGAVLLLCVFTAAAANDHFVYWTSWRDLGGLHSPNLTSMSLARVLAERPAPTLVTTIGNRSGSASGEPHGRLVRVTLTGARSGIHRDGLVYLPPEYFLASWQHVQFPVVELLHGSPGIPNDWINGLRADMTAELSARRSGGGPVVVVIPDTNGGRFTDYECQDSLRGPDETYLSSDVHDWITQRIRVRTDPAGWVLAGYSTGGYCAVNLLDHHPELYAGAASMDGYFAALQDRYTGDLYGGSRTRRERNSPLAQWQATPPAPHRAFLLLAGGQDDSLSDTLHFASVVRRSRTAHVLVAVQAGAGHNFSSWRTMLPTVFSWAWSILQTPALDALLHRQPADLTQAGLQLAAPECQAPNGGLRHVAVCKARPGHHWYRTTPAPPITAHRRTETSPVGVASHPPLSLQTRT